ncbi:hypothetical protein FQR65_LT15458 [Abscondita terminalis]|nr:hypothetical protein FQR65_LT15458 [Abscondita terminalis]
MNDSPDSTCFQNIPKKNTTASPQAKASSSTATDEKWECAVCYMDYVADMRKCAHCGFWVHEECIGLAADDMDEFLCPESQSWPKAVDLSTAMERLMAKFTALEFDAVHETNYNRGYYTQEECNALAKKYEKGVALCRSYLVDILTIKMLMDLLIYVGLADFVGDIHPFDECHENKNK